MARLRRMIYQRGMVGHIYQRARSGFVLFYSAKDSLVFFTMFSLLAKKHRIRILGLCLMYNHVHILVTADGHKAISCFMQELSSKYSKAYNTRHSLKGRLLSTYGLSNKRGDKQHRTALAYLYNNPVEDRICERAEEWHWNFLAYADSTHPYSEKLALPKASARMRRAVATVKIIHSQSRPLSYEALDNLFTGLNAAERHQLVDFIVREYSVVDFDGAISYYGSYKNMLTAFSSNTGSEYEINEPRDTHSGTDFRKMAQHLASDRRHTDIGDIFRLTAEERIAYMNELVSRYGVTIDHARKFMHIETMDRKSLNI